VSEGYDFRDDIREIRIEIRELRREAKELRIETGDEIKDLRRDIHARIMEVQLKLNEVTTERAFLSSIWSGVWGLLAGLGVVIASKFFESGK
jgi:hypothetical protein